jgi:uncharacterized membrane protein
VPNGHGIDESFINDLDALRPARRGDAGLAPEQRVVSRVRFVVGSVPRNERVEALVDGIFGVAMTLLVLDIKLPEGVRFASNADALAHFASVGEALMFYVLSFIVLAIFWIAHDYQFRHVERLDRVLLWVNIVFLLLITTVPFTTNLVATHSDLSLIVSLYAINLFLLGALLWFHAWWLRQHRELATEAYSAAIARGSMGRIRFVCLVPLVAIVVAQFSPQWGLRMFLLLAAMHFAPHLAPRDDRTQTGAGGDRRSD